VPIGVVLPKSVEDILETVALCREFGAPIARAKAKRRQGPLIGQIRRDSVVSVSVFAVLRERFAAGSDNKGW